MLPFWPVSEHRFVSVENEQSQVENGHIMNGQKPAVLCLIDFSEASGHALKWAGLEASKQDAQLVVLYPYRLTQLRGKEGLVKLRQGIDTEAIVNFEKIARENLHDIPVKYEFKPEVGFMTDRVYAHSHQTEFSMLVISKHMAMNNRESIGELIDLVKFPLVIIPQNNR
jgi:hypothetical protein